MARYFVVVLVLGEAVWADHVEADSAKDARELAEVAFLTPLPEVVIAGEKPEVQALLREAEARAAEVRTWPYKVEARLSRAKPRGQVARGTFH